MLMSKFQKIILGVAGCTALTIGLFIMLAPVAFYASYGIQLEANPDLLNELRAPGANLAVLGAVVMAGLFVRTLTKTSVVIALVVFLTFPIGRVVGIVADGMPSESVLAALAIEIVLGVLLLAAFAKRSGTSTIAKPVNA